MASAMFQAYTTIYSDYNAESLFISVSENFYEKFIVTQDYCVSNHSSFCSVEMFKFHLVLIGSSLDQILQRLDKYHFTFQIVDCICILYKYRLYSHIISSRGEVFNQLNRAVEHNLKCRIPEKLPSVAKIPENYPVLQRNVEYRKETKNDYLSSAQKLASTQTLGAAFLGRFRKVPNSKYEINLLKTFDCFIDGYGTVNSEHINFSFNN